MLLPRRVHEIGSAVAVDRTEGDGAHGRPEREGPEHAAGSGHDGQRSRQASATSSPAAASTSATATATRHSRLFSQRVLPFRPSSASTRDGTPRPVDTTTGSSKPSPSRSASSSWDAASFGIPASRSHRDVHDGGGAGPAASAARATASAANATAGKELRLVGMVVLLSGGNRNVQGSWDASRRPDRCPCSGSLRSRTRTRQGPCTSPSRCRCSRAATEVFAARPGSVRAPFASLRCFKSSSPLPVPCSRTGWSRRSLPRVDQASVVPLAVRAEVQDPARVPFRAVRVVDEADLAGLSSALRAMGRTAPPASLRCLTVITSFPPQGRLRGVGAPNEPVAACRRSPRFVAGKDLRTTGPQGEPRQPFFWPGGARRTATWKAPERGAYPAARRRVPAASPGDAA